MKCSHCAHPISIRSRNCGNCGAPHEVTVRHQLEVDAKLGRILRTWIGMLCKDDGTSYDARTQQINVIEEYMRDVLEPRRIASRAAHSYDPFDAMRLRNVVTSAVSAVAEMYKLPWLCSSVIDALKDERFDAEHTRVMDKHA